LKDNNLSYYLGKYNLFSCCKLPVKLILTADQVPGYGRQGYMDKPIISLLIYKTIEEYPRDQVKIRKADSQKKMAKR
jgi:hypothetical protein